MADQDVGASDGSDFDVEDADVLDELNDIPGVNVNIDPIDRVQQLDDGNYDWIRGIFDGDDADDNEFLGFQNDWETNATDFQGRNIFL